MTASEQMVQRYHQLRRLASAAKGMADGLREPLSHWQEQLQHQQMAFVQAARRFGPDVRVENGKAVLTRTRTRTEGNATIYEPFGTAVPELESHAKDVERVRARVIDAKEQFEAAAKPSARLRARVDEARDALTAAGWKEFP